MDGPILVTGKAGSIGSHVVDALGTTCASSTAVTRLDEATARTARTTGDRMRLELRPGGAALLRLTRATPAPRASVDST